MRIKFAWLCYLALYCVAPLLCMQTRMITSLYCHIVYYREVGNAFTKVTQISEKKTRYKIPIFSKFIDILFRTLLDI